MLLSCAALHASIGTHDHVHRQYVNRNNHSYPASGLPGPVCVCVCGVCVFVCFYVYVSRCVCGPYILL